MGDRASESSSIWLVTERLALRRFTADDLDWLEALYVDDEVARHIGGTHTREQTAELLQSRILGYYDAHPGMGNWVTMERESGERVGFHLLNNIQGETIIQVGFALVRSAWGRGYGTEMAAAVLRHGFVTLGLERIAAIANLDNVASQHVLQKIGLHRRGERAFPHPAYAASGPLAWFERERADWVAERGGPSAVV